MVSVPASILITGCNRGLGFSLTKQWARYPNVKHIFACSRKPSSASQLNELSKSDPRIHCLQLDVNSDTSINEAKNQVQDILGADVGLNLLVNNAGIKADKGATLLGADRSVYLQHMDTNAVSVAKVIEAFYPLLKATSKKWQTEEWGVQRSAVINISAFYGSITMNTDGTKLLKNIPYRLSKAAVNQLTRTLAVDLAADKILVVSMCPGWMRTDMGGPRAKVEADESAKKLVETCLTFREQQSGSFISNLNKVYPF